MNKSSQKLPKTLLTFLIFRLDSEYICFHLTWDWSVIKSEILPFTFVFLKSNIIFWFLFLGGSFNLSSFLYMVTLVRADCCNTYPADETNGKQRSRKVSWMPAGKQQKTMLFLFQCSYSGWDTGRSKLLSLLCQERIPIAF